MKKGGKYQNLKVYVVMVLRSGGSREPVNQSYRCLEQKPYGNLQAWKLISNYNHFTIMLLDQQFS